MTISRRKLLQGLSLGAGSALILPVLHQLQLRAEGVQKFPLRFVFVLQANGFHPWAAQPEGIEYAEPGPDKVVDVSLEGHKLPEGLSPLEPHKDRVTILQHLSAVHTWPFHTAYYSALSGARREPRNQRPIAPTHPTLDAMMARRFPGVLPILNVGVAADGHRMVRVNEQGMTHVCSAWAADKPIATQTRPDAVYQALFGHVAKQSLVENGKALDQVTDEIKRAEGTLPAEDREHFERYLDAFESLDAQQLGLQALAKQDRGTLARKPGDEEVGPVEANRLSAMFEMAGAALVSGLTNVVTVCSGLCDPNGTYQGLGFDIPVHPVGHFQGAGGKSWQEVYTMMRKEHLTHIAKLIERLKSIPEGDGTMFDNTLIVYTSDAAETHHSEGREWPFVLIGNLGGKLRTGRYIDYPGVEKPGNRITNALFATLAQAAGSQETEFNLDDELRKNESSKPLTELLA